MSKRIWGTIVSSAIIIGAGAGGVFWIHEQVADELAIAPKLAVASSKGTEKPEASTTSNASIKKHASRLLRIVRKSGHDRERRRSGLRLLYNNKGDVITNAHVVEGSKEVTVRTLDHQEYQGIVIGIGEETDIAVVRVPDLVKIEPLPISSTKAEVGDEILALGSPLGFENTVTTGIISGLDRSFEIEPYIYTNLYQISAPITNGNSGGPLINAETGEVLGINSTVVKQEGGIGFSIPITSVLKQVQQWSESSSDAKSVQTARDNSSQTSSADLSEAEGVVADFTVI